MAPGDPSEIHPPRSVGLAWRIALLGLVVAAAKAPALLSLLL